MVEVIKAGLYDTIQDLGRMRFMEYGVPVSGVMDQYSASLANSILGNDSNSAIIECVGFGPKLRFLNDTMICVTGANMSATLNSKILKTNSIVVITKGDELLFGKLIYGCRTYISVLGGFQTEEIMESRSMYAGITSNHRLKKGDVLPISEVKMNIKNTFSAIKVNNKHFKTSDIEVYKGPEFDNLNLKEQKVFFNTDFTISNDSNRMAYQFENTFENKLTSIITSLVLPGTVQLTPSGKVIVLMRDCQITGGYPRILQLTELSINVLSQKAFSDKIRFKCIN